MKKILAWFILLFLGIFAVPLFSCIYIIEWAVSVIKGNKCPTYLKFMKDIILN